MGFGNGAFQAAKIAIDGTTIIENISTGKVQTGPNVGVGVVTVNKSTLIIPIFNNQDIDTPKPFQQLIQLTISQYSQLQGVASDLSNIYFSSDRAGTKKLYSWRETPASLNTEQNWWVLLPNGIPANSTILIYLQVSSSTALDGVYTGEAPQLSSTYAQYDNGANVFTNYWNFSGTSLPGFATVTSNDGTLIVNNGLTLGTDIIDNPSYTYIVSTTTYSPQLVEFYLSDILINPGGYGGISTDFGFSSSRNPEPQGDTTTDNFINLIGGAIHTEGGASYFELWDNNTKAGSIGGPLNIGIYGIYINPMDLYYNYSSQLSSTTAVSSSNYILLGISSAGSGAYVPKQETIRVQWLRTRVLPPNGVMPSIEASLISTITSSENVWTAQQIFSDGLVDVNPTYAYVADYHNNTVSVIDTSTNTVVDTIAVGSYPFGVAITPNGLYACVSNVGSNNVSVIDVATNTLIYNINVGTEPVNIAITPNGKYVYVVNVGSNNVSVIDTTMGAVINTISVGNEPWDIAITPDGRYAYVTNYNDNTVSVIDTANNTVVNTIAVATGPIGIAITPDGLYAYVACVGSNAVSVIFIPTNTFLGSISVGTTPLYIAITPNGEYAYVTNNSSNNVSVISIGTTTISVVDTITVGTYPYGIAVTPNGKYVYCVNAGNSNVSVIDTSTNTVVNTIPVESGPRIIASTPYFYTSTGIALHLSGFKQNTSTSQTTLTGSTAGTITYSMPTAEGAYKKFVAYASGYENDTTTAQTISFPTAFINTPYVVTAPSGLISSTTTTGITLSNGTTTIYNGWIIIEGY